MKDLFNKKRIYIFLGIYSLLLMFFCAGTSPFIDNMSTDSSVFFTIGRSMVAGKVPYLDLFDHKGLYIYFINYLGALVSENTSIGMFFVEYLFLLADVIICFEISKKFIREEIKSLFVSVAMLALFLNYFTYQGGNFVEVYALTFQLVSFWIIVLYMEKKEKEHPPIHMFIHGVCFGIVFFLRANMIMMWGGIALPIIITLLLNHKIKNAILNILFGIAGVLVGVAPPLMYTVINGSFLEMINQSIVFNIKYSKNGNIVLNMLNSFTNVVFLGIFLMTLISVLIILFSKSIPRNIGIIFMCSWIFSMISVTYVEIKWGHYYENMIPFFIPLIIVIVDRINFNYLLRRKVLIAGLLCVSMVFSVFLNFRTISKLFLNTNSKYIKQSVKVISEKYKELPEKEGSVLVTNNLSICYNEFDVIPEEKYFYIPFISYDIYPDAIDAQKESILEGRNKVLIINYSDYSTKMIFPEGEYNKELLNYIDENYYLDTESYCIQMWVRK